MKARDVLIRVRGYARRAVLLAVILWLLVDFRVRLWRHPYKRVRLHADDLSRRGPRFRDVGAAWIVRWIGRMAKLVPRCTCLVKALALQVLLARRGLPVEVVIGVRFAPGRKFEAHAWVEYHGRVLLGNTPDLGSHRVLRREVIGCAVE